VGLFDQISLQALKRICNFPFDDVSEFLSALLAFPEALDFLHPFVPVADILERGNFEAETLEGRIKKGSK
jgi:hypothetical protein